MYTIISITGYDIVLVVGVVVAVVVMLVVVAVAEVAVWAKTIFSLPDDCIFENENIS